MPNTYYETDNIVNALFIVSILLVLCVALYITERNAEKKARSVQCFACFNRGMKYPPNNCPRICAKYKRNGGDK